MDTRRIAKRLVTMSVVAFLLALAILPAAAQAGVLNATGSRLSWTFTDDKLAAANDIDVTVTASGSSFVFTDNADTITLSSNNDCSTLPINCGCTFTNASHRATCPRYSGLTINAGGQGDTVEATDDLVYGVTLNGGSGDDQLTGGPNADSLDGSTGEDTLDGAAGDDTLTGGANKDIVTGGAGTDLTSYNDGRAAGVTATLGGAFAGNLPDQDTLSPSIERLEGSAQADTLTGSPGVNILSGLGGSDVLIGAANTDTLNGGTGTDTASYSERSSAVTATIGGAGPEGDDYISIENLTGGNGADNLTGDAGANRLDGGAGDDTLRGAASGDSLIGGTGTNTAAYDERATGVTANLVAGGPKPDGDAYTQIQNLRGSDGDDTLFGDAAKNRLDGGPGDDALVGGGEVDELIGGGGRNTASYEERSSAVSASLDTAATKPDGDTYNAIASLRGGAGDDTLTGDDAANTLDGGGGADTIVGGGGIDDLRGGVGDDNVRAADGTPDQIDCGDGADAADIDNVDAFTGCEAVTGLPSIPVLPTAAPDADRDGFNNTLDCNDSNAAIRPGAPEIPGNAVDENCDKLAPDFPLVGSTISMFFAFRGSTTRVTELTINAIVAGGSVEVRCKPPKSKKKACPFKRVKRSFPSGKRKLVLTSVFKGKRLPVGTVLDARVLGPNAIGKVRVETIRKSKTSRKTSCLRPGATKTSACPLS